jgi:hypothetical protein
MTEELDKVLNAADRIDRVHKYFVSLGSTEEQAATAAKAFAEKFTYDGAVLSFQGKPVIDARDDVIAHFKANKLDFLLPPPKTEAEQHNVDPALLAEARAGSFTAKGKLFRALHGNKPRSAVAATEAELNALITGKAATADDATKKKTDKPNDHKTNPFHKSNWNLTAQARLLRAVGPEKCAAIANAVGSKIGATRPNMDF